MQKTPEPTRAKAALHAAVALCVGLFLASGTAYVVGLLAQTQSDPAASTTLIVTLLGFWTFLVTATSAGFLREERKANTLHTDDKTAKLERSVWYQQIGAVAFAVLFAVMCGDYTTRLGEQPFVEITVIEPRLMALLLAGCAFVLFIANKYAIARAGAEIGRLQPALRLSWLCLLFLFADAVVIFLQIYTGWDWSQYLGWTATIVFYLLLVEVLVLAIAYFYQPARDRALKPAGDSLLLGWAFGKANPVAVFSDTLERSYGVRLRDTWVARFVAAAAEPLLLAAAVLLWLSTCFTVVPVQSEGVRVTLGKFSDDPLGPGLHLSAPWPFGHIHQIDTKRVRSLEIGYGEDLGGPVLWTERHYEGEKNMLVGDGDELLTVNVPVYYRISDPVAFLRHTESAEGAVSQLAFRQLVRAMASSDSFGIMIANREAIRESIRDGLQQEVDQLGLGLEVVFVGLKDIHPPIDVAGSYQDVISAQEDKLTYIIDGETYRIRRMPETRADVHRRVTQAEAAARQRELAAQGDTQRFVLVEEAQRGQPGLFRTRLLLDHIETSLAGVPKVVLDEKAARAASANGGYLLDLRLLRRDAAPPVSQAPASPLFDPGTPGGTPYIDENRPPPGQGGFEEDLPADDMGLPE